MIFFEPMSYFEYCNWTSKSYLYVILLYSLLFNAMSIMPKNSLLTNMPSA